MVQKVIFLVILMVNIVTALALAEKKIMVFYPSPYGEYEMLRTHAFSVGSGVMSKNVSDGDMVVERRIYFGEDDKAFIWYVPAPSSLDLWAENGIVINVGRIGGPGVRLDDARRVVSVSVGHIEVSLDARNNTMSLVVNKNSGNRVFISLDDSKIVLHGNVVIDGSVTIKNQVTLEDNLIVKKDCTIDGTLYYCG